MFLVVFVTLTISIIGLFVQILSVQTSRIANAQMALMQTMSTWQGTAVTLAMAKKPTNATATGCQMTSTVITAPPVCLYGGVSELVTTMGNLPAGYNTTAYTFYSVVFTTTTPTTKYVLTFVHDTDTSGNLILPANITGGFTIGYSLNDMMRQFTRGAPPNTRFGSVTSSGVLSVISKSNGATASTLSYSIPTTIPVGAFAVISAAQ